MILKQLMYVWKSWWLSTLTIARCFAACATFKTSAHNQHGALNWCIWVFTFSNKGINQRTLSWVCCNNKIVKANPLDVKKADGFHNWLDESTYWVRCAAGLDDIWDTDSLLVFHMWFLLSYPTEWPLWCRLYLPKITPIRLGWGPEQPCTQQSNCCWCF